MLPLDPPDPYPALAYRRIGDVEPALCSVYSTATCSMLLDASILQYIAVPVSENEQVDLNRMGAGALGGPLPRPEDPAA